MPDPDMAEKKTRDVTVWLSPSVELELRRLAERDQRKLSDYIGMVLHRHVFGHAFKLPDAVPDRQADE